MITLLFAPLIVMVVTVEAGFLNRAHFTPATNIVSSRTVIGSAVGGGPTSGAVSTAHYYQTVAAPATVHTIITSHPGTNLGYPGSGVSTGGGGNDRNRNTANHNAASGGNSAGGYENYAYNSGAGDSSTSGGGSGHSRYDRLGNYGNGPSSSGYNHAQPSYYNQRY